MAAPVGGVWAMKNGDFQPANFASTQAGIQAALDYIGSASGGEVYIGPGSYTNLTNFTVYAKTKIRGGGVLNTELRRAAGATGTFFREKTAGEGNTNGAAGIVMEDMILYGNATGDGIDFGNQGGSQFTSNASLRHICVRDFTNGKGIRLNANAIQCYEVWAITNKWGLYLAGGESNRFYGLSLEQNSTLNLYTNQSKDKYVGLHLEQSGTQTPMIRLATDGAGAQYNEFYGTEVKIDGTCTNIVELASGIGGNQFYGLYIFGGGSWTNTYYSDAWGSVLGNTIKYVQHFHDPLSSQGAIAVYRDQSVNDTTKIVGATLTLGNGMVERRFQLTDAATIAVDSSRSNHFYVSLGGNRTMGVPTNATTGQRITFAIYQDGTGGRTLAFSTSPGGYKSAWSDTGNTANKVSTISFTFDGTAWIQTGAQSPYVS
jgi:hypothetical protein